MSAPNTAISSTATPRAQRPPPYLEFGPRGVVLADFKSWKPHDIKAQSNLTPVLQVAWNVNGQRLATCGNEKSVRLWRPCETTDPRRSAMTGAGHKENATSVGWSTKHPELFCSASEGDKSLMFWDARKKDPTHRLETKSPVLRIAYAPDGESVVLLDKSSTFSRLHLRALATQDDPTPKWSFAEESCSKVGSATDFKFNHAGDLFFVSTGGGSIACVEYPTMEVVDTFDAHLGSCDTLDLDPRGRYLATGGSDSIINIFNNVEMLIHRAISVTDLPVRYLAYSFDGEYLAAAVAGPEVLMISSVSGEVLHRGLKQLGHPAALAWHPSKLILATCGDNPKSPKTAWISFLGMS